MLRILRRAWANYVASIPKSDFTDSIPESQWDQPELRPTVSKAKRKAFSELLAHAFSHLPQDQAASLIRSRAGALQRADEPEAALREALSADESQEPTENLGFILCDWKATEEVQWQAELLCDIHRLTGTWQAPAGTMEVVLGSLDVWLSPRGLRLVHFSVGDSVAAFAVPKAQTAEVVSLGRKLGLSLSTAGEA